MERFWTSDFRLKKFPRFVSLGGNLLAMFSQSVHLPNCELNFGYSVQCRPTLIGCLATRKLIRFEFRNPTLLGQSPPETES